METLRAVFDPQLDRTESIGPRWVDGIPELPPRDEVAVGWSVPWSDLMMVMFILFVVLFVTQVAEQEVGAVFRPDAEVAESSLGSAYIPWRSPGVRHAAVPAALPGIDVAVAADDSVRLTLPSALLFELGSAEIGSEAEDVLANVASVLGRSIGPVQVIGHTDDFPLHDSRYATNWELSAARAAAVARALIRRGVLDPRRFTVMGRGMYAPLVPNTSAQNKARNRRVEILIPAPKLLRAVP
jgi:chemotaxis protein MotB